MYKRKKSKPSYPKIIIAGKVAERNEEIGIAWNAPKLLKHFLRTQAKIGDYITATFEARRPKRSEAQNNYFHVYLSLISLASGYTMKELKNWYKKVFLTEGITEVYGDQIRIVKSSADLNISEFVEFMNRMAEKTEIPLPDPAPFNLPLTHDQYKRLVLKEKEAYSKMKAKIN